MGMRPSEECIRLTAARALDWLELWNVRADQLMQDVLCNFSGLPDEDGGPQLRTDGHRPDTDNQELLALYEEWRNHHRAKIAKAVQFAHRGWSFEYFKTLNPYGGDKA
jgi:hypothetical protein